MVMDVGGEQPRGGPCVYRHHRVRNRICSEANEVDPPPDYSTTEGVYQSAPVENTEFSEAGRALVLFPLVQDLMPLHKCPERYDGGHVESVP